MTTSAQTAEDLVFASIAEQGRLLRAREISPVELTEAYLARIEQLNSTLNAYITVTAQGARASALRLEHELTSGNYRGPLHGIPYGVKDQILTEGVRTTAGSSLLESFVPAVSATVVRRMDAAGAILLGKHNLDEWGKGGTEHYPFGEPRNPWNLEHIASGSSSGSGIATAAGLCSAAIGEDTGGSVRQPAAANGIVGLRPTFGRISRYGTFMYGWNMDCLGPLTRTVEDAATLFGVMSGSDPLDPLTAHAAPPRWEHQARDLSGRRFGVVTELVRNPVVRSDVLRAFNEALRVLESLGASVEEVSLPLSKYAVTAVMLTTDADIGASFLYRWLKTHWSEFDRGIRRRLGVACLVPATTYNRAMRVRALIRTEVLSALNDFDALLSPTNPTPPPRIDSRRDLINPTSDAGRARRLCVYPFSIANTPAISVPCGMSDDGLPIGLQIAGRPMDELTVFEVAHAYERATHWHQIHPVVVSAPESAAGSGPVGGQTASDHHGLVSQATLRRTRALAEVVGLPVTDDDLPEIAVRLEDLLADMADIERQIGSRLDGVEPVPPLLHLLS